MSIRSHVFTSDQLDVWENTEDEELWITTSNKIGFCKEVKVSELYKIIADQTQLQAKYEKLEQLVEWATDFMPCVMDISTAGKVREMIKQKKIELGLDGEGKE